MCWWTCVFLNIDTFGGVMIVFTLGNAYGMHLSIHEIIEIGYLNSYENVILIYLNVETL